MPSSRQVAAELGLARGTVESAWDQLVVEGYLAAVPRSGMFVRADLAGSASGSADAAGRARARQAGESRGGPRSAPRAIVLDLSVGPEPTRPLGDAAWRSAWRAAASPPGGIEGIPREEAGGLRELRAAIAEHLRLLRAMDVDPECIVVTGGARQGLSLLLSVVARRTGRPPCVAVESPGFPGLRRALEQAGARLLAVPLDEGGLCVADLDRLHRRQRLDLVILTPNHQFPYGTALQAQRRHQLIEWARTTGVPLVEDDYDSEFRHIGPPLPSLWSIDPHCVLHLGTFVAVLGRDVGTGYLVLPEPWVADVKAAAASLGVSVPPIVQRAIATYLSGGGLRRRLARGRRRLSATQRLVAAWVPRLSRLGSVLAVRDTGHLLVVETTARVAATVHARCLAAGVRLGDLAEGWAGAGDRTGLLVSYGGHDEPEVAAGLRAVHRALAAAVRQS